MKSSFDSGTPVLDLRPAKPEDTGWVDRWVLWPVALFQVVIPAKEESGLNLFQRAVLGLKHSGMRSARAIAEALMIEEDLAAFIIGELQSRGLLDRYGEATDRGGEVLAKRAESAAPKRTGFMLLDARSGRLLPHVMDRQLAYCDTKPRGGTALQIELGTSGKPLIRLAVRVEGGGNVVPPSPRALTAAYQHSLAEEARSAALARAARAKRPGWRSFADKERQDALRDGSMRIHLASPEPQLVYLPLQLYVYKHLGQGISWRVRDPFGNGDSTEWRRCMARQCKDDSDPVLTRVLNELYDEQTVLGDDEVANEAEARAGAARGAVDEALRGVKASPELRRRLAKMEYSAGVAVADEQGRETESTQLHRRDFVRTAYQVVEQVLADTQAGLLHRRLLRPLSESNTLRNRDLLLQLARKLGFETPPGPQVPQAVHTLLTVTQTSCLSITNYGGQRLREQLAVGLLLANKEPAYPLAGVCGDVPDLLTFLADLHRHRNVSAHASTDSVPYGFAATLREKIYAIVTAMLGGSGRAGGEGALRIDEAKGEEDLNLILLVRVRKELQETYGYELDQHEHLQSSLEQYRVTQERVRRLLEDPPPTLDFDGLTGDYTLKTAAVLECVFRMLLESLPAASSLAIDGSGRDPDRLRRAAHQLGVTSDGDGLSGAVANVQLRKVTRAIEAPERAPLTTLLALSLLIAAEHPGEPVSGFLQRHPSLVADAITVASMRGHGGSVAYSTGTIRLLDTVPDALVQGLFDFLYQSISA